LSGQNLDRIRDNQLLDKLQQLNALVSSIDAQSIMLAIEDKHTALIARKTHFDLVQGDFFEQTEASLAVKSSTYVSQTANIGL
jgi:EAL domain-containing protein (putative c-di-GMP-specific phosphodiesterase class I)